MDGPKVNLKFYKVFKGTCLNSTFHSLIDNGVCSLNVVHGAFRIGVEVSGWKVKTTLKCSHKMLHETLACREDYTSGIGSTSFPLFFCSTRWVDNKRVSDHLILLWQNIISLLRF